MSSSCHHHSTPSDAFDSKNDILPSSSSTSSFFRSNFSLKRGISSTNLLDKNTSSTSITTNQALKDRYGFFKTTRFKICFFSMCLNVLLFGLDQFIITVAVPEIVDEFQSLRKVQWLNTAFFIPCAGAILIYTQFMSVIPPKWVYLAAVMIFEIGSAICGSAQSMDMLIVGRAVAGLGGAGMYNATYFIGGEVIPFHKRATWFSFFGISYIGASVLGPLVGGAFTDMGKGGWRWCFYINLPVGAVTLLLLFMTLPNVPCMLPFDQVPDHRSKFIRLLNLDWISAALTLGFVSCLGIGLQWGGITKPWNSLDVILTLWSSLFCFILLLARSSCKGKGSMIPMSLLKRRHFTAGIWVSFFGYGAIVPMLYYLPLYFEAIKNKTAVRAGILLLGLQLTMCPMLIVSGKLGEVGWTFAFFRRLAYAQRTGQSKIFILLGGTLVAVGSGLFTLLRVESSIAQVIGFEVVAGVGFGLVMNIMVVLIQADYLHEDHLVPHVTNVMNFWGFVGRIVAMSTGTNLFLNKLMGYLDEIPELSVVARQILAASPEAIWYIPGTNLRTQVLEVYTKAIDKVWFLTLSFGVMIFLSGACMRNINIKKQEEEEVAPPSSTLANPFAEFSSSLVTPLGTPRETPLGTPLDVKGGFTFSGWENGKGSPGTVPEEGLVAVELDKYDEGRKEWGHPV